MIRDGEVARVSKVVGWGAGIKEGLGREGGRCGRWSLVGLVSGVHRVSLRLKSSCVYLLSDG